MKKVEELEKELKKGTLANIYLLFGEEQYLVETCVKKIRQLFGESVKGINDISIDETNVSELIQDIETPSFGYDKKIIVAKNTGLFKKEGKRKNAEMAKQKEKLLSYLEQNKEIINQSVILVFIEPEAEKQKLFKWIDENGIVCEFSFQKPVQIQARLMAICKAYQVQIDSPTMLYLLECCGTNMQDLINEIRKLIEYVGKGGIIQKKDIDQLCIKKLESVIFDLTDQLGKKQINQALSTLKNLIYAKEPLPKIMVTLYHHFKKIYLTKLALQLNKDIVSSLNLKPNQIFLVNKYKKQANDFQEKELRGIVQDLADLDYQVKNGLMDLQIGLETILCEYCG